MRRALHDVDPAERRDILEDLRTHIHQALAERGVGSPTVEDVRHVLSTMDVPEAFRRDVSLQLKRSSKQHRIGRIALIFFLGALGVVALSFALVFVLDGAILRGGLILGFTLMLAAFGFGLGSWRDPYGKATAIGAVLAIACALLFLPLRQATTQSQVHDPSVESLSGGAEPGETP